MRTGGRCVLGAGGAGAGDGAGGRRRERSDEAPDRKLGMPPGCDDTERMLCCCCCERRTITSDPQSAAGGFTFSVGCESFRGCPAMRDAAAEAAADGVGVLSVMTFCASSFGRFGGNYFAMADACQRSLDRLSLTTYYPSRVLHKSFSMLDDH